MNERMFLFPSLSSLSFTLRRHLSVRTQSCFLAPHLLLHLTRDSSFGEESPAALVTHPPLLPHQKSRRREATILRSDHRQSGRREREKSGAKASMITRDFFGKKGIASGCQEREAGEEREGKQEADGWSKQREKRSEIMTPSPDNTYSLFPADNKS